jgi:hypothetical protein
MHDFGSSPIKNQNRVDINKLGRCYFNIIYMKGVPSYHQVLFQWMVQHHNDVK